VEEKGNTMIQAHSSIRRNMHSFLAQSSTTLRPNGRQDSAVKCAHRAAFSGGLFAKHQQLLLAAAAEKKGYQSPFWISRAQATKKGIQIIPGAEPTVVPADEGGVFPVNLISCCCLDKEEFAFFRESNPVGGVGAAGPIYFRADRWRLVSDRSFVQKLHDHREQNGFAINQWIEQTELQLLNLKLDRSAFAGDAPPVVSIEEGSWTHLFNAEQTEAPEKLVAVIPQDE
jgi:hypothetical protein